MDQRKRYVIAVIAILLVAILVLGIDFIQRQLAQAPEAGGTPLPPGAIPIYVDGEMVESFMPDDIQHLDQASFVDAEEGKTQEGWLLYDVLVLRLDTSTFSDDTQVVVSSTSREKSAELTWAEVKNLDNMLLFDLSGRGTLKLVSLLPRLDVRDEWVQDCDLIEVYK